MSLGAIALQRVLRFGRHIVGSHSARQPTRPTTLLRALRSSFGFSDAELGRWLEVSSDTIHRWSATGVPLRREGEVLHLARTVFALLDRYGTGDEVRRVLELRAQAFAERRLMTVLGDAGIDAARAYCRVSRSANPSARSH